MLYRLKRQSLEGGRAKLHICKKRHKLGSSCTILLHVCYVTPFRQRWGMHVMFSSLLVSEQWPELLERCFPQRSVWTPDAEKEWYRTEHGPCMYTWINTWPMTATETISLQKASCSHVANQIAKPCLLLHVFSVCIHGNVLEYYK